MAAVLLAPVVTQAAAVAWWRMQEATAGFAGPGGESPEAFLDSIGSRHLDDKTSSPQYANANPPVTTNGIPVAGNVAYSTGYAGGQGLFTQAPGFLDDTTYTWEAFFRRGHNQVSANFYGNDRNDHYNGISRVGVTADGDVVLQLTGNDVGTVGNTPEEFVFPGPDDAAWHHVAFTFDNGVLQGFVDYQPAGAFVPQYYTNGRVFTDYAFLTVGFANEVQNPALGASWDGELDEIRVSDTVLSPSEFLGADPGGGGFVPVATLTEDDFSAAFSANGAMQILVGTNTYLLESTYSFPSAPIGTHALSGSDPGTWTPVVQQTQSNEVQVTAVGGFYTLHRTVRTGPQSISVEDALTNTVAQNVGVLIGHVIKTPEDLAQTLLAGVDQPSAAGDRQNPTLFLSQSDSHLGFVAVDTISRIQFEGYASTREGRYEMRHFALAAGASRVLAFALYPLPAGGDYWAFINRVRVDWGVNHTVEAFEFGPTKAFWDTPGFLPPYLARKRVRLASSAGFLDYDNYWIASGFTIEDQRVGYKANAQAAMAAIKAVDPAIQVLGDIEAPFYSLTSVQSLQLYNLLPPPEQVPGFPKVMNAAMHAQLLTMGIPVMDSVPLSPSGTAYYELYFRATTPLIAVLAYPADGNAQEAYLLERAAFLLDEVGLDGFFLDGGGPVNGLLTVPAGWDGFSVDIDPTNGQIVGAYTDFRFVTGSDPVVDLFDFALSRGKTVVANGFHYTREMQSLNVLRAMETGGLHDPLAIVTGQKPPLLPTMFNGHLSPPSAFADNPASHGQAAVDKYAEFVMKDVMTHLRNGLLYFYFNTEIPETGPGSGEYGPINKMFPFTPVELHEGWLVGQERIVTAVSGTFAWNHVATPRVHAFGLDGRPAGVVAQATNQGAHWTVDLVFDDWTRIVIIDGEAPVFSDLYPAQGGAGVVLEWTGPAGSRYGIDRSTDLRSGFSPLASGLSGTMYTDPVVGVTGAAYRVWTAEP